MVMRIQESIPATPSVGDKNFMTRASAPLILKPGGMDVTALSVPGLDEVTEESDSR